MEVVRLSSSGFRSMVRSKKFTRVVEWSVSSSSREQSVFHSLMVSVSEVRSEFHIKIKSSMYLE